MGIDTEKRVLKLLIGGRKCTFRNQTDSRNFPGIRKALKKDVENH